MSNVRDWDGATYDRISSPQQAWGREVLERPREFLRTVSLGSHLLRLPDDLRESFVEAVHERLGDPYTIDYVRLNIDAVA
jgi:hypothetical protein